MNQFFVVLLLSSSFSLAFAAALTSDANRSLSRFNAEPSRESSKLLDEGLDALGPLNVPLDSAFEISRRIWDKVVLCETCHSAKMNDSNSYLPVLQGQNRQYLYSKITSFKKNPKLRHPFPMFIHSLSQDEIIDISLYYALQQSALNQKLVLFEPDWRSENEAIELSIGQCLDCHDHDGNGSGLIPDISGQNRNYLAFRIRQIANNSSAVHLSSHAPVSCEINRASIMQSRKLADRLAMVVDESRLSRGAQIYQQNCLSCHEGGKPDAPILDSQFDWTEKLTSGLNRYVEYTTRSKSLAHNESQGIALSRKQWVDAMHYIVDRSSMR